MKLEEPTVKPERITAADVARQIAEAKGEWCLVRTYDKVHSAYAFSRILRMRGCETTVRKIDGPQWKVYGRIV